MTSSEPKAGPAATPPDAEATQLMVVPGTGGDIAYSPTLILAKRATDTAHPASDVGTPMPDIPPRAATLPGAKFDSDIPASQVGRYQILERIGRGGMATVFKAPRPLHRA